MSLLANFSTQKEYTVIKCVDYVIDENNVKIDIMLTSKTHTAAVFFII